VPFRYAFQAKAALEEMLGTMNLDVIARRPSGAIAAEAISRCLSTADKLESLPRRDVIKKMFFLHRVKTRNVLTKIPESPNCRKPREILSLISKA
jgi:hypothetical protein